MWGHKASLDYFYRTENISNIFSDHNSMTLEINYINKAEKFINMIWNNRLQNNKWVK